ncbi:hypothetical protein E4P41_04555 [Geodermatophilus sp. DF01-2]|uniref:hypothetical protein n=1 Tax=Geodermatophilus sp. DF01-2 TaxID=2559610 RepID=UPI0010747A99|nr:hypothetical protein [Geodermatophilus sp. DF01_2]TFV63523.1 hypothetical protein E4P41_04555 [Geodermatophilus sp. DF01_2]
MTVPETNGPGQPTRRLPGQPSVSTAPPPSGPRRWWSTVPHHLGRARTSTVVLVLLFVGLFTLYLYVRPPSEGAAGGLPDPATSVTTPVTTPSAEPTDTTEPTPADPTTTSPERTPTPNATTVPPPQEGPTGEETPAESAEPTPTTAGEEPTTQAPQTAAPTTTGSPGT